MPPSWIPLCKCMQLYCEPYFTAIERWRNYKNKELLNNRIALIETSAKIFSEYSQNAETHLFDLEWDHVDVPLLDEVPPSAGKSFVFGGDSTAFDNARKLVPEFIFNKVGVFFQTQLLKAMAGISDNYLLTANHETRTSIIAAIEKLFRLSEECGRGRFVYKVVNKDDQSQSKVKNFASLPLGVGGKGFVEFLLESNKTPEERLKEEEEAAAAAATSSKANAAADSSKKSPAKTSKKASAAASHAKIAAAKKPAKKAEKRKRIVVEESKDDEEEEDEDNGVECQWTTEHSSVGEKVAQYFPQGHRQVIFVGDITTYCPPSEPKKNDQLYHVAWSDGDECDYEEADYTKGKKLYEDKVLNKGKKSDDSSIATSSTKESAKKRPRLSSSSTPEAGAAMEVEAGSTAPSTAVAPVVAAAMDVEEKADVDVPADVSTSSSSVPKAVFATPMALSSAIITTIGTSSAPPAAPAPSSNNTKKTSPLVKPPAATATSPSGNEAVAATTSSSTSASKKKKAATKSAPPHQEEEPVVTKKEEWTDNHESVGVKVAAVFKVNRKDKVFSGSVTEYCPPTAANKKDQLYHVVWEDGDECDYEEPDYREAIKLYIKTFEKPVVSSVSGSASDSASKKKGGKKATNGEEEAEEEDYVMVEKIEEKGSKKKESNNAKSSNNAQQQQQSMEDVEIAWTEDHPSVGKHVAQYFGKGKKAKLFHGKVMKYAPETSADSGDQLYHVEWDDGDECDMDEQDYVKAIDLYQREATFPKHALIDEVAASHKKTKEAATAAIVRSLQDVEVELEQPSTQSVAAAGASDGANSASTAPVAETNTSSSSSSANALVAAPIVSSGDSSEGSNGHDSSNGQQSVEEMVKEIVDTTFHSEEEAIKVDGTAAQDLLAQYGDD